MIAQQLQQKLHLRQLKVKPLNKFRLKPEETKLLYDSTLEYIKNELTEDDYILFLEASVSSIQYNLEDDDMKEIVDGYLAQRA